MEVYKKINNNVALARDAKGRELVVFGKGIGFASMPYELTDLSRIQRTFYDVNEKYLALLRDVPEAVFLAADDIADTAREELDCTLNANLTYALADHLNFAIQRSREGLNVQVPLAYDIQHLYPHEYAIAKQGLHELCRTLAVDLAGHRDREHCHAHHHGGKRGGRYAFHHPDRQGHFGAVCHRGAWHGDPAQ